MGEALISRAGGGAGDSEQIVPIVPGYHSILTTVKLENQPIGGIRVTCKDGSTSYNYTTNEKGQCLFMVNSGAANVFVNNNATGYQFLDYTSSNTENIDAPAGSSSKINLIINRGNNYYEFTSSKQFALFNSYNCNIIMAGGGGGGSGGDSVSGGGWAGGGGGGGAWTNFFNGKLNNGNYKFSCGSAGSGGRGGKYMSGDPGPGGSGGTSVLQYENNGILSATGGGGAPLYGAGTGQARGGEPHADGQPSRTVFGGGGGGGAYWSRDSGSEWSAGSGGSPYGGSGASSNGARGGAGRYGGGGGGGCGYDGWGGSGGSGVIRININYNS